MAQLELVAQTAHTNIITRGSLVFNVDIKNTGVAPVDIPTGPVSPFEYRLRALDGVNVDQSATGAAYSAWLTQPNAPRPRPPIIKSVNPAESVRIIDDIGLYSLGRIRPGRYEVVAHLSLDGEQFVSQGVEILVRDPSFEHIASTFCPHSGHHCAFSASPRDDDSIELHLRETRCWRSDNGIARLLETLPHESPAVQPALALNVSTKLRGRRWVAWLDGEVLTSSILSATHVLEPLPPAVKTDLADPKLLPIGFSRETTTLFLIIGTAEDGETHVQRALCNYDDESSNIEPSGPLFAGTPETTLARYIPTDEEKGKLEVIFSSYDGSRTRILMRRYDENGRPEEPAPVELYETDVQLLALDVERFAPQVTNEVFALFGPREGETQLTFARISLELNDQGERALVEKTLPEPLPPARSYALLACDLPFPVVAAALADELLCIPPNGAHWTHLATTSNAEHLSLRRDSHKQRWLEWYEPAYGLRYAQLRP